MYVLTWWSVIYVLLHLDKQTPSLYTHVDKYNWDRSIDMEGLDNANSIVTFHDICFNDKFWLSPSDSI